VPPTLSAPAVCRLIHGARFHFASEDELQQGIAQLLAGQEVPFQRELRVGKRDRLDFFLPREGIAVEVKTGGTLAALTRQLYRYAAQPGVSQLILVTTRSSHRQLPQNLGRKPLYIVHLNPLA